MAFIVAFAAIVAQTNQRSLDGALSDSLLFQRHAGDRKSGKVCLVRCHPREPVFQPAVSKVGDKCADDRKGKSTQGLGITRSGKKLDGKDMWEGGKIRDPNEGEEFSVRFMPIDGGKKMEVRGYVGTPLLGKTQTWVRGDR